MRRQFCIFLFIGLFVTLPGQAQQFQAPLQVTDGNTGRTVWFGIHPNGTDGFDPGLDTLAPPPPPSGVFGVQFVWQNQGYYTDIRDNSPSQKTFVLAYQPGAGGTIVLHWDASQLSGLADFTMTDNITGTLFFLDMTTVDSLVVDNAFIEQNLRILIDNPVVGITPDEESIPQTVELGQNYPNPFNPSTTIPFRLDRAGSVKLTVYNILGQQMAVLLNAELPAGSHRVQFQAQGLPAGIYLYRLETPTAQAVNKMLLIP